MSIEINGAAIVMSQPAATVVTNASHTLVFDKTGYDYANIYLLCGTHHTSSNLSTITLSEHSSVTVATSMTAIEAFTGGTSVVSGSTGFIIPDADETGAGCVIEFQVDLRKRMKKIALIATNSNAGMNFASMAVLHRAKISADTATEKTAPTCHSNTSTTRVAKVVTG